MGNIPADRSGKRAFARLTDDILQIRTPLVNFHALREEKGIYLIDCGFICGFRALIRALNDAGWGGLQVLGIVVTHGHLDHILNVAAIAKAYGAWIAAPRLDTEYYAGRPEFTGSAKAMGLLDSLGRQALSYEPFIPDRLLDDGDLIDVWEGLQAVHLPGHTPGHMAYFCRKRRLAFAADTFASYGRLSHFPPAFLNSGQALVRGSARRLLSLEVDGLLPNHGDRASPGTHLRRLRRLLD